MNKKITDLLKNASEREAAGGEARNAGNEPQAEIFFRNACALASQAADTIHGSDPERPNILLMTVRLTLRCGETAQARQRINEALASDASLINNNDWIKLCQVETWNDEWLMAAVRQHLPDEAALNALVGRHWNALFGRCLFLTLDRNNAADLAQKTWHRVLRSRQRLNPGRCFSAYLVTVATNLWRDSMRAAVRAGPLAENRLVSLDGLIFNDGDTDIALIDTLPDLSASSEHGRRQLVMDIDQALVKLSPLLREVLVARYIDGESCAEIGRRHGRTEQTISSWVRQAIQQIRCYFESSHNCSSAKTAILHSNAR